MKRSLGCLILVGLLAACSADDAAGSGGVGAAGTGGLGGTGAFGGVGGAGGGVSNFCNGSTSRLCYCNDGSQSTQSCTEGINGAPPSLLPCICPETGGTGGAGGGTADALCDRLMGMGSCTADTYVSPKLPASILFLVDRSGSMLCNPPPEQTTDECDCVGTPQECPFSATTKNTNMPTKWDVTTDALKSAFDSLAAAGGANAGLTLFNNNDGCGVGSNPSVTLGTLDAAQAARMSGALDGVSPGGATPIVGGTLLAYQHLHWEAGAGCTNPPCGAPGNRFVVLITDGADTCAPEGEPNYKQNLLSVEVQKARMANIRTFVIGAPGSEPARGFLSELAFQGGTARNEANCAHPSIDGAVGDCHFDLTSSVNLAADLQIALGDISGAALTCEFTVPGGAGADVNVQYTLGDSAGPTCVSKLPGTACDSVTDGWMFARDAAGAEDRSKVLLCGAACEQVKADLEARVDVIRGCNPLE